MFPVRRLIATAACAVLSCVCATVAAAQAPVITQQPASQTVVSLSNSVHAGRVSVAGGFGHSLFIKMDGSLWGAGSNLHGQLGDDNTYYNRLTPVQIATGVTTAAAGRSHSLFVKSDGTLWAMGENWDGALGDGTTTKRTTPVLVATEVASVAAGWDHSLFVKRDGTLWGMGRNAEGALGDGTGQSRLRPVQVATDVVSAAAGWGFSRFLKADGTLWAMGGYRMTPAQIASDVAMVAGNNSHSLFVKTDGTLWATGANIYGQLGDGTTIERSTPVMVATGVATAGAGYNHSVFIKTDGTLWTMGWNLDGQLGDGTYTSRTSPAQIATEAALAVGGSQHTAFVKSDGSLWTAGGNNFGQLGDGTNMYRPAPVQIAGGVAHIAVASFSVTAMGSAPFSYQWRKDGVNISGATNATLTIVGVKSSHAGAYSVVVSNGAGAATSQAAVLTVTGAPVISVQPSSQAITTGMGVAFGVTATGTAPHSYQWRKDGVNIPGASASSYSIHAVQSSDAGAFTVVVSNANGSVISQPAVLAAIVPIAITTQPQSRVANSVSNAAHSGVKTIAAGRNHTLFVKSDGTLWATGLNQDGQLGDGTLSNRSSPVQVATGVAAVAAGERHSLFVKADGTLWAMGLNEWGQLGDGTNTGRTSPVQVGTGVASVTAGWEHSLFVKTDGTLWAAGSNWYGQLGDGTLVSRSTPVQVASGVASVAAGYRHTLFLKQNGTLWTVGDSIYGQRGIGISTPADPNPSQLATDVVAVAAGMAHSLFVKADATLWVMGLNTFRQLGDGTTSNQHTPLQVATGVTTVAGGRNQSFFVKSDGTLWGMGLNDRGQLGDGTSISRGFPVQISTGVAGVAAGGMHGILVKTDGTFWTTGANDSGQLGGGSSRTSPLQVDSAVSLGPTVIFSVGASGTNPTYQWRKDGVNIPGTTGSTLTIIGVLPSHAGVYTVVVSNGAGSVTSNGATLTQGSPGVPPTISSHPSNQTVAAGGSANFSMTATGTGPLSYQWRKDGVSISGANASTLTISNAQSSSAGSYSIVVSNGAGSVTSNAATLTVNSPPPPPPPPPPPIARLINVSTRANAGSGEATLIVGFVIGGTGSKTLLIRGIGPKLLFYGVPNVVTNPALKLYSGQNVIAENDDWVSALAPDFATVGAFTLDAGSKDAAMKLTLAPGAYTIHLVNPGAVAEALVEVYDFSKDAGTRLVNLSCRLHIGSGDTAIVGTVLEGGSVPVIVRNIGPGLVPYGVTGILPDPKLRIFSGQTMIAENDDWSSTLASHFAAVGAFPLTTGSKDAAHRLTVAPGAYTVHATGTGNAGVALVELYESK